MDIFLDAAHHGSATCASARPDVARKGPRAPTNIGYSFHLETTKYPNGDHVITVKVKDTIGNEAAFRAIPVTINNPSS